MPNNLQENLARHLSDSVDRLQKQVETGRILGLRRDGFDAAGSRL